MAIGIALIGGGIWAKEEHLPAILASKEFELKAVYSRSLKSAKETASETNQNIDVYSDDSSQGFEDLLKRDDISAVLISLAIINQPPFIRAAIQAKKHVLSEKPIAENVADSVQLIKWYHQNKKDNGSATWSVAENFRYLDSYMYARQHIERLGKIIGFRVHLYNNIQEDSKFYQTSWRKNPTHQGGFLLDGGVHYTAALRLLLGPEIRFTRIAAFTTLLKQNLPPVDTVDAVLRTNTGIQGTFQMSAATTLKGKEFTVACENGTVTIADSVVTVCTIDGAETSVTIQDERTGVPPEIRAWGEALTKGQQNAEQIPEEALADLELIELMLRSGEAEGQPQECYYQNPRKI